MQPTTLQLLQEAGLHGGDRCLDLGCGGGNVVLDMALIIGPRTDSSPGWTSIRRS